MKRSLKFAAVTAAFASLASCYQMAPCGTETIPEAKVVLSQDNYRVLATRVSAEDNGFCILPGLSVFTKFLALIPGVNAANLPSGFTVTPATEAAALDELYKKTGADQPGRATQLINVRKEIGGYNAIIFGRPKVRVTADLIEFTR